MCVLFLFIEYKGINVVCVNLVGMFGILCMYVFDWLDLIVSSMFDVLLQCDILIELCKLCDFVYVRVVGFVDDMMLECGDLCGVMYSFMFYECVLGGNCVLVQVDMFDKLFDINEGVKLDLGLIVKLCMLVMYFQIVVELYKCYVDQFVVVLCKVNIFVQNLIECWVVDYFVYM